MNEHEEKTIAAFILKEKKDRYRSQLGSSNPRRRNEFLGRLNHCKDLDLRYVTWLSGDSEVETLLRAAGSPDQVYLLSCSSKLDKKTMRLVDAIHDVEILPQNGWGTIVSCIPSELAYYYDEEGTRKAILQRKLGT